jgi:hypothetical protein
MDKELHRILYDLEENFEECQFYINQIKNFHIKDRDIKGAKHRNKLSFERLQKMLIYKIIFLRALKNKLENG